MNHSNSSLAVNLWQKLLAENLVEGQLPSSSDDSTPWYIKFLQGLAGWFAAFFLLGSLVTSFVWIFDNENAFMILTLGLMGNASAFAIFKFTNKNEFLHQLGLVFNLCAQLLVAWGIYEAIHSFGAVYFIILAIYQLVLVFVIQDFTSRVLTTWFATFALYISFGRQGIFYLTSTLVSAAFIFIWMNDYKWISKKSLWEPIGYGLAISLLQLNGQVLFDDGFEWWFYADNYNNASEYLYWMNEAVMALLLITISLKIVKEKNIELNSSTGYLVIVGLALFLVLGYYITGVSAAFLLLLIGFWKQRKILLVFGVLTLISFVSWFYYSLHLTLLVKSLLLMGFGIAFFVAFYGLSVIAGGTKLSFSNLKRKYKMTQVKWIAVVTMLIILISVNHDVYKKEQVLADGTIVLLELAPVDPRSLMQGDYMRLRFDIERTVLERNINDDIDGYVKKYYLVVDIDSNNVGQFSHLYQDKPLEKNQIKMEFRLRNGGIKLATNAFFFQEGTGDQYEPAKYGEFRVAESGQLLLNNLRDESFEVLGINRP